MLYRVMPKSGDEISVLGFGCMRLPVNANGTIDEERAQRQVRHAIDRGLNYVDTAWPYHSGKSESFLGRALADGYRERVKVATKLPVWLVESRGDMDGFLDAQRARLNTDRIDYYLLHGLSGPLWDRIAMLGAADFLDKAKADGRIVNAGFSFHGTREDFKRIVDSHGWDFCQIQYNFMDEENQAGTEGLEYAASRGLGVVVMEPLLGGKLAGVVPPAIQAIWNGAEEKHTPSEWALRWVWNHPGVTVALSGMNEEIQIEENLATADKALPNSLTEAELRLVKKVEQKYRELVKVDCTGCGYCMPCPEGVAIPSCFKAYNDLHMFDNADGTRFSYAIQSCGILSGGKTAFASQCIRCGQCTEKCPQNLKIPELLEAAARELEGPELQQRLAMIKKNFRQRF